MKRDFVRIFLKNLVWIALLNAFLSVSALFFRSGWFNKILELVVGILNFPTIWFIVNHATAFLKSPNVNWYIASALLSLFGSLIWALAITLIKMALAKKQSTEPVNSADPKGRAAD